jgi:hypothetical protein
MAVCHLGVVAEEVFQYHLGVVVAVFHYHLVAVEEVFQFHLGVEEVEEVFQFHLGGVAVLPLLHLHKLKPPRRYQATPLIT